MLRGKVRPGPGHEVREPRHGEEASRKRGSDVEHRMESYQERFEVPGVSGGCLAIRGESRGPPTEDRLPEDPVRAQVFSGRFQKQLLAFDCFPCELGFAWDGVE